MRLGGRLESPNAPMPRPRDTRTSLELKLLQALIERCDRSPPSQVDVEKGVESGLARLMALEARLRQRESRAGATRPSGERREDDDLGDEIRALREAISELRARTIPEGPAPLARGFVFRREP
jgi:hypothetical protein